MRKSFLASISATAATIALVWLAPVRVAGQAPRATAAPTATKNAKAPRTPWGDPDLQGQWNSQTSTPLERPLKGVVAEKNELSEEEAETLEATNRASFDE